jgi:aminopeptidase YwaD
MSRIARVLALLPILALSGVGLGSGARQDLPSRESGAPESRGSSLLGLPPSAERAYTALASRFNPADAVETVSFMDQYWRLAGNPGYDASIDHISERLLSAGFSASPDSRAAVRVDAFPNNRPGWDYRVGTVAFVEGGAPLLSRERDRVSLAINSFPTPRGGRRAALVDVGNASPADFEGRTIRGAVVLTDAPLARGWREAVTARGAIGVISTDVAPYIRPRENASMTEAQRDVLQWGSIPYDPVVKGFGFKASWRAADRMRRRLRQGPAAVRVHIESTFYDRPNRTLVAEIRGRSRAAERIVMVAHVQEPGASDNGSGCGTLLALARALNQAIAAGALPPPERTLTFLWADEIRGSQEWIRAYPEDARRVQYMFALDMTGEDIRKTGGTFLIEKQADPAAVWPRPSDPHTEWGAGEVTAGSLKGSLLNDLHLAVCLRRARDADWIVRTNPYEGGSDHTVFADAKIPSLLSWHFTDRYYHTNQDRPDKTSAAEMQNVGIAVGASAWFLASADAKNAEVVATLLAGAASRRLALERAQGRELMDRAQDRVAAAAIEQQVLAAWIKWYGEALDSVLTLPVNGPTDALRSQVAEAKRRIG